MPNEHDKNYNNQGGRDDVYEKDWDTLEADRMAKLEQERRLAKKDAKDVVKTVVGGGKMDAMGKGGRVNQARSLKSKYNQKGEDGKIFRKEVKKQAGKEVAKKVAKKAVKAAIKKVGNFLISTIGIWGPILLIFILIIFCVMAVIYYVCEGGGFGATIIGRITGLKSFCPIIQ